MKPVLSIHSSVTVGFVGNNVVGPVLTGLGLTPLLVPTVLLAAHPGYGRRVGDAVPDNIVRDILAGLDKITGIEQISGVISGYLGSVAQTDAIAGFVDSWRRAGSGSYILDPVLGDRGRLYLPEALALAMIEKLLPRADIITPNSFELGYLSGMPVSGRATAETAAQHLITTTQLAAVIATGIDDGIDDGINDRSGGVGDLLVMRSGGTIWCDAGPDGRNVAGGGDLLTAILAGQLARGAMIDAAFRIASQTAQQIIAASISPRDLALLENLDRVAALAE
jgi:pyridoxine kinase